MVEKDSLYSVLLDAGIEMSNHCSDLYFEKNEKSDEIVKDYPEACITVFMNQITWTQWYCANFQYTPFWSKSVIF